MYELWEYKTNVRSTTSCTPLALVYGYEVVLPLELEITYLKVYLEGILDMEKQTKARLKQ